MQPSSNYEQNFHKALIGARQGDAQAQLYLCVAYMTALGTIKNEAKAFEWCKLSAEQGNLRAQILVAYMYERGIGTPAEPARAALWFRRAIRDIRDNTEVQEALIRYAGARRVDEDEVGVLYHYTALHHKFAWVSVMQKTADGAYRRQFISVPPDVESASKAFASVTEGQLNGSTH